MPSHKAIRRSKRDSATFPVLRWLQIGAATAGVEPAAESDPDPPADTVVSEPIPPTEPEGSAKPTAAMPGVDANAAPTPAVTAPI